ncbi:MAG: hypothetical protein WCO19_03670 [Candidatus Saccharibacteria bacterium]
MKSENALLVKVLEAFGVGKNIDADDIKNVIEHSSQLYALGPVIAFDYNDRHYYLVDDYSLNDDPKYVQDILEEINHLLKGRILQNPVPQSDGAKYATGIDDNEYYLWESPSI